MDENVERLIRGKNKLERIVSLEIKDNEVVCFHEDKNGEVYTTSHSHKYWFLSDSPVNEYATKLKGNQPYKWGHSFNNKKDRDLSNWSSQKRGHDNFLIYDDKEACMVSRGFTYFKGMKHTEPSVLAFDIEATGLYHDESSKVLLISNTFRKNGQITKKLFAYDDYDDQASLIIDWCKWVREVNPSILVAHNGYTYDIPYLNFVAKREGVSLLLGRDGSEITINKKPSNFRIDGSRSQEYNKVRIMGREFIDSLFVSIKQDIVAKKHDSYALKSIIKVEGLEKKDRVFYDSTQIRFKYKDKDEWIKIKNYCIDDADDCLAVYDKFIPAYFYLSQNIPKSFQLIIESATGSQLNALMIRSYLQDGWSIAKASEIYPYKGAISVGYAGAYKNCLKLRRCFSLPINYSKL